MAPRPRRGRASEAVRGEGRPSAPQSVLLAATIYFGFGGYQTYQLFAPWLETRGDAALWQSGAALAATLIIASGLIFLQRWAWWIALFTMLIPALGIGVLLWLAYGTERFIGPEELRDLVPFAPVVAAMLLVGVVMLVEPASLEAFRARRLHRAARDLELEAPEPDVEVLRGWWTP